MSLAIALDNSPEIISRLDNLKNVLKINKNLLDSTDSLFIDDIKITSDIIDDLLDWVDDIYKILTDINLFTEDTLTND